MIQNNCNDTLYTLALALLPRLSPVNAKQLLERAGSATSLFENLKDLKAVIPDITDRVRSAFVDAPYAIGRAKTELEYIEKKNINILCLNDERYPERLRDCNDAPVVLFYLGNADLNQQKVISMVGTRKCTQYGKDICKTFIADLKRYYPDVLVVSGLAYGVDVYSHRAALDNQMNTVGVLAHGLDRIYPAAHRDTAAKMVHQGGLLTEYTSGTTPEKVNFVRRNRIVAGIADATIVVESADKGGSLITADIASSYNRDVFAFPGRVFDQYSEGCNRLIKEQKAVVIQNAEDLINAMCWPNPLAKSYDNDGDTQLDLFRELDPDEALIVECLMNCDEKAINQIVVETGINYNQASSILFSLEMKGIVTVLGGARYHLRHLKIN